MKKLFISLLVIFHMIPVISFAAEVPAFEFIELYSTRMDDIVEEYKSDLSSVKYTPGISTYFSYWTPSEDSDRITCSCSAGLLELSVPALDIQGGIFTVIDLNASDEKNLYHFLSLSCSISALECSYSSESALALGMKYGLYKYDNATDMYIDICIEQIWEYISAHADDLIQTGERRLCYEGKNYQYFVQYFTETTSETSVENIYIIAELKE